MSEDSVQLVMKMSVHDHLPTPIKNYLKGLYIVDEQGYITWLALSKGHWDVLKLELDALFAPYAVRDLTRADDEWKDGWAPVGLDISDLPYASWKDTADALALRANRLETDLVARRTQQANDGVGDPRVKRRFERQREIIDSARHIIAAFKGNDRNASAMLKSFEPLTILWSTTYEGR